MLISFKRIIPFYSLRLIKRYLHFSIFTYILFAFTFPADAKANTLLPKDTIEVKKLWDRSNHNAFPDLIKIKNHYYLSFREGENHVGNQNNGAVRVMRSKDLKKWETLAILKLNGKDVREAHLSEMADGRILVTAAAGVWKDDHYLSLRPYISFSDQDGIHFSPLELAQIDDKIEPGIDWIWRVTWDRGTGYGVLYHRRIGSTAGEEWLAYVVKTKNGKDYEWVSTLEVEGQPNECTIRFDENHKMFIMIRRESGDRMGYLGMSDYPYTDFVYHPLSWRLGGPNFLFLNKTELIMGSRFTESNKSSTVLFLTDLKGKVKKTIKLPSGGDTSYPGLVIHKKNLWVAYYSGHEGKSSIYLAKVKLNLFD